MTWFKCKFSLYIYIILSFYFLCIILFSCASDDDILEVESICISTSPLNIFYNEGDLLDLSGLVVDITRSDKSVLSVPYSVAAFANYGLSSSPSEGSALSMSDNSVTISYSNNLLDIDQFIVVGPKGNSDWTFQIGNQIWMAKNLDVYISSVDYDGDDYVDFEDVKCWDNGEYGKLYTWEAAKLACPSGWHLPCLTEFEELVNYLIDNGYNYDGSTSDNKIAKSLASKIGWNSYTFIGVIGDDSATNNSTGFSALPGGLIYYESQEDISSGYNGTHLDIGNIGYWWLSSDLSNNSGTVMYLKYDDSSINWGSCDKNCGLSVRCLKD